MDVAIDIETDGLDATKFIMGCLITDRSKKSEIYYDKKELWDRVITLGRNEKKRGKRLNVWSHNAQFDFYGYAEVATPGLIIFCEKPFIAQLENINFLDTMGIYRMSLAKAAKMIGMRKMDYEFNTN